MKQKEGVHVRLAMQHGRQYLRGVKIYKNHGDQYNVGMPDTTWIWNGHTSWIEFKRLMPNESIHRQLKEHQLLELIDIERNGEPAWVIAFRAGGGVGSTEIYRPTALSGKREPTTPREWTTVEGMRAALSFGGLAHFPGYDYDMVVALILEYHANPNR